MNVLNYNLIMLKNVYKDVFEKKVKSDEWFIFNMYV